LAAKAKARIVSILVLVAPAPRKALEECVQGGKVLGLASSSHGKRYSSNGHDDEEGQGDL